MATNSGGWLYETNGTPVDKATADNAQARVLEIKQTAAGATDAAAAASAAAAQAQATANSYAGQIAQANTTAGSAVAIANDAKGTVEAIEGPISTRLGALEVIGGLEPGDVSDATVQNLITQEGTGTRAALNEQSVQAASLIKAPLNVLQRGADPSKSAAINTVALNAAAEEAATDGRALYFPPVGAPIKISDGIQLTGTIPMIYGDGSGSMVEQTVWPKPFLDTLDFNGITVAGIHAVNSSVRRQTGFMTEFRGNTAKNYSAFLYANGDDIHLYDCVSDNFNAGFYNLGSVTKRHKNARIENFEFLNGEFGAFSDFFDGLILRDMRGNYSMSVGGTQAPHLFYLGAYADSANTGLTVDNARATGGRIGSAFQLKGIVGGSIRKLIADDCEGVLTYDGLTDTTIDEVTSLADVTPHEIEASFNEVGVSHTDRCTFSNINIHLLNDAQAIRIRTGSGSKLNDATVTVSHTTTNVTSPFIRSDIAVEGGWEVNRPTVINTGPKAWDAIYVPSGEVTVDDPRTVGARIPVRFRGDVHTPNGRVFYDRDALGRHATDGLERIDLGASTTTSQAVPKPTARTLLGNRNLLQATFEVASGSGAAPGLADTGQAFTQAAGVWRIEDGTVRNSQASTGAFWADTGQSDVEVSCDLLYRDGSGIAFRAIDPNNYLHARVRFDHIALGKNDAGVGTTLLNTTLPTLPTNGRRYRLSVRTFGAEVKVYLDGELALTHTLIAGDLAKFGAATRHGLRSHTDTVCRFSDLRVDSLR